MREESKLGSENSFESHTTQGQTSVTSPHARRRSLIYLLILLTGILSLGTWLRIALNLKDETSKIPQGQFSHTNDEALLKATEIANKAAAERVIVSAQGVIKKYRQDIVMFTEKGRRVLFYLTTIEPLLKATERANKAAAERTKVRLHDAIKKYRQGITPFADYINSYSTRFYTSYLSWVDRRHKSHREQEYKQYRFKRIIFDEEKVRNDVTSVIEAFRQDLNANSICLLSELNTNLTNGNINRINVLYSLLLSVINANSSYSNHNYINEPCHNSYEGEVRRIILKYSTINDKELVHFDKGKAFSSKSLNFLYGKVLNNRLLKVTFGSNIVIDAATFVITDLAANMTMDIMDRKIIKRPQLYLSYELNNDIDILETQILYGKDGKGLKTVWDGCGDDLSSAQTTAIYKAIVGGQTSGDVIVGKVGRMLPVLIPLLSISAIV